jgi:energy-coupling factor transport system ATP-binding protein
LVFQYPEYQLFEDTVFKDISFGPKNMGLSEKEIENRVLQTANDIGLSDALLKKSPFDLSGGQKRRVAIAGIIAMQPKILILDEPTAGLDPKGRDRVLSLISEYHKRTNSTILLVSHSMEDIAKYAEKILVMNKSEVFAFDTIEKVFSLNLSEIGLDVPQITRVFNKLKKYGYFTDKQVYTVEYAVKLLKEYKNV